MFPLEQISITDLNQYHILDKEPNTQAYQSCFKKVDHLLVCKKKQEGVGAPNFLFILCDVTTIRD